MATNAAVDVSELIELDRKHILHPFLAPTNEERVVMVHGSGCRLTDAAGKSYLDATGGLWLAQVGHGRQELAQAAAEQIERLEYFTCFWEYSNDCAVRLASRVSEISPFESAHIFFTSGGTEGNEAAIKMTRYHHASEGRPERTIILARTLAYHGVGCGSGSLTGMPFYHDGFGPMLSDVRHLTPPYPYHTELYGGEDPVEFCVAELERTIAEVGEEKIAAMVGEPIMGVAGMVVPPEDYWPRIAEVLRKHGILLVLDEVVTAYGRTGHWFAAERFGVEPDIIITAKGIASGYAPLGAVVVSDRIIDSLQGDHGFPMGYTYGGHATACAIALANLDIIENEGLLGRAREVGGFLLSGLRTLEDLDVVGEVRGEGMMFGVELVANPETREPLPMDFAPHDAIRRETGVIVRDCGSSLVLSPPLVMSEQEAEETVAGIRTVLERVRPDGTIPAAE